MAIDNGGPGDIPLAKELTAADEFENAIRKFGVVNACEWFGYESASQFTKDTLEFLLRKGGV